MLNMEIMVVLDLYNTLEQGGEEVVQEQLVNLQHLQMMILRMEV